MNETFDAPQSTMSTMFASKNIISNLKKILFIKTKILFSLLVVLRFAHSLTISLLAVPFLGYNTRNL